MKINQFFQDVLGVNLKNPRWSWGAIDQTSNRVFLRIWKDQIFQDDAGERVQVYWKDPRTYSHGYAERLEQIEAIKNGAQGIGIITKAVDVNTPSMRQIESYEDDYLLQLGEFSEDENGAYLRIIARVPTSNFTRSKLLTSEGKAILQLLVNYIRKGRFLPENEKSFMGYREVHTELGLEQRGPRWGNSLRAQGLANLAEWLHQNHLPAITGLIVDQTDYLPGEGYFKVNDRPLNDNNWWREQARQGIIFDWSPYVNDDTPPTKNELDLFTQAVQEGTINTVPVDVRVRCEALRKRARQYYRGSDGKLKCEICGWYKPDNRISGDIVELHHIRPLAQLPNDGVQLSMREAIESLAPLCPCCHRIIHARIGGRSFTLDELKSIIPRTAWQNQTLDFHKPIFINL